MALAYFDAIFGTMDADVRWCAGFALIVVAVAANVRGVELVGNTSYVLCILVCTPPLVLTAIGLPSVATPAAPAWKEVLWLHFLTSLMWNTSGFDDAGATAAEVTHPGRVYPRALGISVALVTGLYVLP